MVRVIDADTLAILVDAGFGVSIAVSVRVLGVDAPERYTAAGEAASVFARTLFTADPRVTVRTELDRSFARYLGAVTMPDGREYARLLVEAGHGTAAPS